jgi:dipeptidyl aminopeptidase/acylaminoacyl peptidase
MAFLAVSTALFSQTSFAQAPQTFTLEQVLNAPYATNLTAAPTGSLFAWVEHTQGRNNLFLGGPHQPTRQLTANAQDDAQDIAQLAWAPDSSAIAYTYGAETGASGKPANPAHLQRPTPVEVWIAPLTAETSPIRVGEGHSPLFGPLNHGLFFIRSGQIWTAELRIVCSSGTGCELQVPPTAIHQLVFDRGSASSLTLSPDGRLLAFISHRSEEGQPSHSFLAVFDLHSNTLHFPAPSTGNDSAPVFSPNGHQLAWLRSPFTQVPEFAPNRTSPNPWSIQLVDLTTGETGTVFIPEPNQRGSALPHLADGEPRLYFTTNDSIGFFSEADGWVHLYEIHASDTPEIQEVQWMTPGPAETEDPVYAKDHRYLIYASNQPSADPLDRDRRHLWHLDLTQPDILSVQLTHGTGIETHPVIAADGTLAALVSDARTPMHPALIGKDGSITPLHPAALPSTYPAASLVTPQRVLIPSTPQPAAPPIGQDALSLTLHGQLFLPPASTASKHPAILFVHGGPNRQMLLGYPAMDYYSNAFAMNQYLTSRGFIVLSVNYRCGIGYGLDFRQCIHAGPDGAEEYSDILAAAKYLRSRTDVDPTRIGIWGGSYGGYLTALALARNSNLFAAGVDFHGVHDWNLEDNASDWKQGSNAAKDAIAAKALASSPLADLTHWTSPVLLIHGDDDPDVAYAQTPTLAEALRARNVPVQELIFPDELHGFLLHKDWLAAYTAAAAFFERTLGDRK